MAPKKKSRGTATLIDTTRFHFVEPLQLDVSPAKTREWDDLLAREALCRGATEFDVMERLERRKAREEAALAKSGFEPLGFPADFRAVREASASLREVAQKELSGLPPWVQASFDYDIADKALAAKAARRPPEPAWPRLDYYIMMRGALYQNGYDDPAESVFGEICEGDLLGHQVIGGVHAKLAKALQSFNERMRAAPCDVAELTARAIKSVAGFVPRFQALKKGQKGPAPLSNHALGLAIDIDFVSNPHIKEPAVIAVMREITGIDFGRSFTPYSSALPPVERVKEIHKVGQQASDALQEWLQRWLPVHLEIEARKKIKASFSEPVADSETDRNLGFLATILKYHKLWEVKVWKDNGIQSIPVELAAGLVEAGLRWGSAYENHKDAMHFELLPQSVLRPDKKARLPEDVLQMIAP
jgi:hypothetical protein